MQSVVDIKDIFENLNKAADREIKTMTEGAFKEIFLPVFINQDSNPHDFKLANWVEFAGGPFRPVKITDDKGAVLFTVPPIYNRKALDDLGAVDAGGRPLASVSHMLTTYGQMARIGPGVGENYINAELTKRFDLMKNDVDYIAQLQVWKDIFTRYGVGDQIALPGEAKSTKALEGPESGYQDEIVDL